MNEGKPLKSSTALRRQPGDATMRKLILIGALASATLAFSACTQREMREEFESATSDDVEENDGPTASAVAWSTAIDALPEDQQDALLRAEFEQLKAQGK